MKKIIILSIFTCFILTSFGQVIKYRSQSWAECKRVETTGEWGEWSELTELNILITADLDNLRIKLYAGEVIVYDIVYFDGESSAEGGAIVTKFKCIDDKGENIVIRHFNPSPNDKNKTEQLYIDFSDILMVFNMNRLD
jgi:hypothetical protein